MTNTSPRMGGKHRKGCMLQLVAMFGFVVVVVLTIVGLAGCGSTTAVTPHKTSMTDVPQADPSEIRAEIKLFCDFWFTRAIETLNTSNAEGNATTMASTPGFPADLHKAIDAYYGTDRADTPTLKVRYGTVITTCQHNGWMN